MIHRFDFGRTSKSIRFSINFKYYLKENYTERDTIGNGWEGDRGIMVLEKRGRVFGFLFIREKIGIFGRVILLGFLWKIAVFLR